MTNSEILKQRYEKLEAQKKVILEKQRRIKSAENKAARKARNHRLILVGGDVEAVVKRQLGRPLTDGDLPYLSDYFEQYAAAIANACKKSENL